MSGHRSGEQARLREIIGRRCIDVHCYAQRLNLVIVNRTCCIQEFDDIFTMEAVYRFFSCSSLRHAAFVTEVQQLLLFQIDL